MSWKKQDTKQTSWLNLNPQNHLCHSFTQRNIIFIYILWTETKDSKNKLSVRRHFLLHWKTKKFWRFENLTFDLTVLCFPDNCKIIVCCVGPIYRFFISQLKSQEQFLPIIEVVELIFVSGMWQADWGKGRNPPMRNTAEHRDRIYSRQKSLKQIKAGRGRLQPQNPYETIRFFRWERTTRDPTHHSKQGKPKGFCPDCLLYLHGIFQLSYLTFLRQALVRLTAQCYSNSLNIFNKKPGVRCQLRDWGCICFCLLLPAYPTSQRRKTGHTSIHRSNTCTSAME